MTEPRRGEVGARMRRARQQRQLSLAAVADPSGISVATLSRIENAKQSLDVDMLVTVAGILGVAPAHFLSDDERGADVDSLAARVSALRPTDRARVMRTAPAGKRNPNPVTIIDDLMSTVDILREELEQLAHATRTRHRR
jgi:transcriptional regulator with XRE-family HTH domain